MNPMESAIELIRLKVIEVRGDGTIWKLAEVTNQKKLRPIVPRRTEIKAKNGYLIVNVRINGKAMLVYAHRLVWEALKGAIPLKKDINHRDGNKTNNHPDNLELASRSENILHAYRTGLSRAPHALSQDVHKAAKQMRRQGCTLAVIANALAISLTTAHRLCKLPHS